MELNYLDNKVIDSLKEIEAQIGQNDIKVEPIISWNCDGGCEGLSTPII